MDCSWLDRFSVDRAGAIDVTSHGGGLVTFGSMVQVVEDSTQYKNDNDLAAIAH